MSDSPVIGFLNKMTDLLLLNAIWIICCIPVFTIGAATTAMYDVCMRSIRNGDGYIWRNFWKAFRKNFWQSTVVWLILLILIIGFFFNIRLAGTMEGAGAIMLYVMTGFFGFLLFLEALYIFPLIARFENPLSVHIRNSLLMAVGFFPHTLIIGIMTVLFFYVNYVSFTMNIITILIGSAVTAYCLSFFYYRVFMHYTGETTEDLGKIQEGQ